MTDIYQKIDLTAEMENPTSGAFDIAAIRAEGVTTADLIRVLASTLGEVASNVGPYLNAGCGFAVVFNGDDEVNIIGIKPAAEEQDQ